MWDADSEGGHASTEAGVQYTRTPYSVQFYYESKIALKTKLHLRKKKEWNASSATTWINVKDIMLSEVKPDTKQYFKFLPVCGTQNTQIKEEKCNSSSQYLREEEDRKLLFNVYWVSVW